MVTASLPRRACRGGGRRATERAIACNRQRQQKGAALNARCVQPRRVATREANVYTAQENDALCGRKHMGQASSRVQRGGSGISRWRTATTRHAARGVGVMCVCGVCALASLLDAIRQPPGALRYMLAPDADGDAEHAMMTRGAPRRWRSYAALFD